MCMRCAGSQTTELAGHVVGHGPMQTVQIFLGGDWACVGNARHADTSTMVGGKMKEQKMNFHTFSVCKNLDDAGSLHVALY